MHLLAAILIVATLIVPAPPEKGSAPASPVRNFPPRPMTADEQSLLADAGRAFALGDHARCLKMLEGVDGVSAAHPGLLNLRGAILCETGRVREAVPYFEWAVEADPGHFWANFSLAECALLDGDLARARNRFLRIPVTTPDERDLVALKLVLIDIRAGDKESARRQLPPWLPASAAGYAAYAAYAAYAHAEGAPSRHSALLAKGRAAYPGGFSLFLKKTLEESGIPAE